jgi:TPR repeat protein
MFVALLLTWGVNYNIKAQVKTLKPKSSFTQKNKSTRLPSKVVLKKRAKTNSFNTNRKSFAVFTQNKEIILSIQKGKDLFYSGFLLQTFRLLNQYKDAPEMDAEAFRILAECKRSIGGGIDTDYKLAEQYFLKSINLKSSKETFLSLGQIYQLGGFKLTRDPQKATFFFQKAVDEDLPFAKFELGRLYFQGMPDSLKDESKGIQLLEMAGNQEVAEAQWMLGSIYAKGYNSIQRDMPKAKVWFKKYKENKSFKQDVKL